MNELVVFEPVVQKSDNDCAIACLTMYLGIPYPVVMKAAGKRLTPSGMSTDDIIATAKKLGVQLVMKKDFDAHDIGIVDLDRSRRKGGGHVAFFCRGAVWTTASGQLWGSLHTYCHDRGFKLLGLLTRRDS